ncbi:MarR family winged helix-turn-helix transcriptional regulator [Cupriavidus sp. WKF15]|uniref:MarR family winged helix-turn-helix transcriptional regulator n=1 Tax=Cupriavidus sp. WKF15 TaxID=3032282 RepID=UPI0023E0A6EB|nr:MarR family winged helix-turn-helix transcriptional regulator [Cupriavidus sp. WKF15]WER48672.1 MarR family winged helix-turn-helix transcriptional regulator [Cupriavidus sp. WKF15]
MTRRLTCTYAGIGSSLNSVYTLLSKSEVVKEIDVNAFDPEILQSIAVECPGFQARATARALTRYYNACFRPLGLTAEQFSLLIGIGADEGATLVELAERAGVDPTTLSRNVQHLESRDLVRTEGGRGRAGKRLTLTTSGRQLVADALPVWSSAKADLADRMGAERLRSARQAMKALAKAAEPSST